MNFKVAEMHSDLDQREREDVMLGFKSGRIQLLVATDIVSRGIDIDDIRMVINYDVPREAEDYVHRIGGTARAGAEGCALTFVSEKECDRFHRIETFLRKEIESLQIGPEFGSVPDYYSQSVKKTSGKYRDKRNYTYGSHKTDMTGRKAISSDVKADSGSYKKQKSRWHGTRKNRGNARRGKSGSE